ncbi:MAG: hypothetical protein HPY79_09540 [Bacteroidales bacterium]|nr:hypothetical protein [Bacteroidales bacterium]
MTKLFLILLVFIGLQTIYAQESSKPTVKFSGFVKTDVFYDTRQSSAANYIREGHFYLFPDSILLDKDSVDINDKDAFQMLSIQTRLKASITGPDAFGAKSSGVVEAEFFGTSDADVNGVRLRHAFVKLNWTKTELLIGQNWHPMFPVNAIPGTVSFNTGTPILSFSRNPQIKVSYSFTKQVVANVTAYSQRDFTHTGPDGISNKYMRNANMPGFNGELSFNNDSLKMNAAAGINFKSIVPEIKTSLGYFTNQRLNSLSYYAYTQKKFKPITLKIMGIYAENATDIMMIGGYAIADTIDKTKGIKKYTNLTTASGWIDIQTNGKKIQFGIFAGYTKNLGSQDNIYGKYYVRGQNIDYIETFAKLYYFFDISKIFA